MSMCDLIFSGVASAIPVARALGHRRSRLVKDAGHLLSTMDYTYREHQGKTIYRLKDGMSKRLVPPQRGAELQEDAIGIRLRDAIGVDNMMRGSDYAHSRVDVSAIAEDLGGDPGRVSDDEQAKIAAGNTARVYNFDVARPPSLLEPRLLPSALAGFSASIPSHAMPARRASVANCQVRIEGEMNQFKCGTVAQCRHFRAKACPEQRWKPGATTSLHSTGTASRWTGPAGLWLGAGFCPVWKGRRAESRRFGYIAADLDYHLKTIWRCFLLRAPDRQGGSSIALRPAIRPCTSARARPCWLNPPADLPPQ